MILIKIPKMGQVLKVSLIFFFSKMGSVFGTGDKYLLKKIDTYPRSQIRGFPVLYNY